MYFNKFCNICFYKENVIKLCHEEYSFIINILISFIGEKETDFIKEKVYLCNKCCENIKNYYNFKKMCHKNLVQFRQVHNKLKKKLKLNNDPDIKSKLSKFVEEHICKENTPIQLDNFKDDTKLSTLNDNEIVNDVDKESLLNDNNPAYIKSECSGESLHDLEYPNLENENQKEINVFKNVENYELPFKQEVIYDISSQKDSDPCDVFSDLDNTDSKLHSEIVLEFNEYDSSSRETKTEEENIQHLQADSAMISHNDLSKNIYKTGKFYQCTMCGKSFFGISNLKRHLLVHTGQKPHKCSFCEKSFALLGNLRIHLRIHTGEKPYMCNICNRTFVTTSRLKDHERVHTGERPYKCKVCNKCFSKSNGLKVHQVVHSGEKIHTCNKCDKSFSRMACLKRHQLVHTKPELHTCIICSKTFSLLAYFKKHQRIHNQLNTLDV